MKIVYNHVMHMTKKPFGAIAVALLVVSCSTGPEETDEGLGWEEPAMYTFVVDSSCGERTFLGEYRVTVENAVVVNAEALDDTAAATLQSVGGTDFIPTVDEMVTEYLQAAESGADSSSLAIEDDVPSLIEIDYDTEAIDDEVCYEISGFEELGGSSATTAP